MSLVYQIFGEGAVANFCQWKDKKSSGITLVMATLYWFLLEIMETRLVPLLCSILLLLMLLLFLWAKFGQLFITPYPPNTYTIFTFYYPISGNGRDITEALTSHFTNSMISHRRLPTPEEINLPDSSLRASFSKVEGLLLQLYEIAYGKDIKTFLGTIFDVAIIDTIGSYINFLTICFFCSMTIPVLYLRFQEVIDSFIGKVSEKNRILEEFNSKFLNKIPRATKME